MGHDMNRLKQLEQFGQSVWLDFLSRELIQKDGIRKRIAEDGIGGMTTKSMAWIAKQHGGRAYVVMNPKQIPNIFLKEAATVSRSAIIEETFHPVKAAESSILKGIGGTPVLLGYVGTTKKPTATNVLQSHQDDPVLSTWQYGLGKAVAWTSDARQRWAAA